MNAENEAGTIFSRLLYIVLFAALLALPTSQEANAQGIELLLVEQVPIPQKRPNRQPTAPPGQQNSQAPLEPVSAEPQIRAVSGNLKQGLDALSKRDAGKALAIRAGLKPGTLERKILAWAIALSGDGGVTSATVSAIAADLPNWPGQSEMRRNVERALAREGLAPKRLIGAFGNSAPVSVEGATALARAHLALGEKQKANRIIAPFWRNERLTRKIEARVLDQVGAALSREDHRVRMHTLFYNDRITAAQRVQGRAEQVSLAKARAAAIRNTKSTAALIKGVAASSRKDPAYLFTQIEHARRSEQFEKAANLLLKAPRSADDMIDTGEWWVERRIASRKMLELGKKRLAYRIASEHRSTEARDIIEAEFHAGWYALRYLNDRATAQKHFSRILSVAKKPLSLARGHYWMGRANRGTIAARHYREAAKHSGTYYGQLAAVELRVRKLSIRKPSPSASERSRFKSRDLVQAITMLEANGHAWRAKSVYRHLARTLTSPGEMALLAARAERRGDHNLSLQVGKITFSRGYDVGTLSWPLGAIPTSAKIGNTGRALAYAIARQESAFNKAAVSPAKARGLLQLLPGTAKGVARRNGLSYSFKRLTSDAGYNATLGAAYLSEQLEEFGNSYILTFAAYNAGPGRVKEWLQRFGDPRGKSLYDVIDWVEEIPFTETRSYVQRVMENYQIYKARISGSQLTIKSDLTRGRR